MLKTNPEGKYDDVVTKRGNMRQEQVEQLLKVLMTGFDKDDCFIKGDGFKDDSEDTANEERMKQDEAPKNQEVSKKELAAIQLSDSCSSQLPVLTQLSHQLCEQLRLILEPTKAAKLQGDFRTGKRLNMRKITYYIAFQFKRDNVMKERVVDMYEKRHAMRNIDPEGSYDKVNMMKEGRGRVRGD
jgi:midasin (ATPase involved in ribosome maturation)